MIPQIIKDNRQKKAARLAAFLVEHDIGYKLACRMDEDDWGTTLMCANIKTASLATREMVLDILAPWWVRMWRRTMRAFRTGDRRIRKAVAA